MSIFHGTELRQPQYPHLAKQRKERLRKALEHGAPEMIVIMMAEGYLRSYKLSWRGIWEWVRLNKFPHWLLWLTDADYRAVCRDKQTDEEFEREMREMLDPRKEEAS